MALFVWLQLEPVWAGQVVTVKAALRSSEPPVAGQLREVPASHSHSLRSTGLQGVDTA